MVGLIGLIDSRPGDCCLLALQRNITEMLKE